MFADVSVARNVGELETEHLSAVRNLVKSNKTPASAGPNPNIFCHVLCSVLFYLFTFLFNSSTSISFSDSTSPSMLVIK